MKKKSKRLLGIAITLVVALAIVWLSLPIALAPLLRGKLQALVRSHLNADLRIGSLRYKFPYGASAWDVHVISANNVELFSADRVEMSLVHLPTASGPLLIRKIVLQKPTVRFSHGAGSGLLKAMPGQQPTSKKLSDILQLRRLTINDGQVSYEDRSQPQAPAMVWQNLNADMNLSPQSTSQYGWDFSAASPGTAKISSAGNIDVDQAVLDVTKLAIDAQVARDAPPAALPAQVQELLKSLSAEGTANFQASGHLPLKDFSASQLSASLQLSGVRADFGSTAASLDLTLNIDKQPDNPQLSLSVSKLNAATDAGIVSVEHLNADVDSHAGAWRLSDIAVVIRPANQPGMSGITRLSGSLRGNGEAIEQYDLTAKLDDLSIKPRAWQRPLEHINGTLHATAGELTATNITASYGDDQMQLQSVHVPLDQLQEKVQFRDMAMTLNLHQPAPLYPGKLGGLMNLLEPAGTFAVHGDYTIVLHGQDESNLELSSDDAALSVKIAERDRMPITKIQTNVLIANDQAQIRQFSGEIFDGTISGTGSVGLHDPFAYQANLAVQNVSMQQATAVLIGPQDPQIQNNGRGEGNFSLNGNANDLASLAGHGEVRVANGQIWRFPIFDGIASHTKIAREALTAGEAAAMFDIANSQVQISSAAINSPALGLQGSGTVGFDGQLDLNVIAAPLGDWQQKVKETGIPLVSAVVGDIAGQLQKVVNSASELLYQFHVTGTLAQPQVQTQPSAMLSDAKAKIFGEMMKKKQSLLETLREFKQSKL